MADAGFGNSWSRQALKGMTVVLLFLATANALTFGVVNRSSHRVKLDSDLSHDRVLKIGSDPAIRVGFAANGTVIVAKQNGQVISWNVRTDTVAWRKDFRQPPANGDFTQTYLRSMQLSRDGKLATLSFLRYGVDRSGGHPISGSNPFAKNVFEPHALLLDTSNGEVIWDNRKFDRDIEDVSFSSNSKDILLISIARDARWSDRRAHILRVEDGAEVRSVDLQKGASGRGQFSEDSQMIAVAGYQLEPSSSSSAFVEVHDVKGVKPDFVISVKSQQVPQISFSQGGRRLIVAGRSGASVNISSWDVTNQSVSTQVTTTKQFSVSSVSVAEDGQSLILAGGDRSFDRYGGQISIKDGKGIVMILDSGSLRVRRFLTFGSFVEDACISSDGRVLAVGLFNGRVIVRDLLH